MANKIRLVLVILLSLVVLVLSAACGSSPATPTPTLVPIPTPTAGPTPTPIPTPFGMVYIDGYSSGDNSATCPRKRTLVAQTFIASEDYYLGWIRVKLYRKEDVDYGDVTFTLNSLDGSGHPMGSSLSSRTLSSVSISVYSSDAPGDWVWVDMQNCVVSEGVKYAIVLEAPGAMRDNCVCWRNDRSSPEYSGGNLEFKPEDVWKSHTNMDLMFEVWGYPR